MGHNSRQKIVSCFGSTKSIQENFQKFNAITFTQCYSYIQMDGDFGQNDFLDAVQAITYGYSVM